MDCDKIVNHIKSENPEFVFTGGSNLGSDISRFYNSIKFDKKKKGALMLLLAGIITAALKHKIDKPKPVPGNQPQKSAHFIPLSQINKNPGFILPEAQPAWENWSDSSVFPAEAALSEAQPAWENWSDSSVFPVEAASLGIYTVLEKEHRKLLKKMLFDLTEHEIDAIEAKMEDDDISNFTSLLTEFQKTSRNNYSETIAKSLFKKYILSSEKYDKKYIEKLVNIDKIISQFPYVKLKFRDILEYEPAFRICTILRNYNLGMYPNDHLTIFSINMLLWGFSERTLSYRENYPQLIEDLHTVTNEKILNYTFLPSFLWERKTGIGEYVRLFMPFFNYLKNKKYDFIDEKITVDILEKHYDKLINKKITNFKKELKRIKMIGEDGNINLLSDLLTDVLHQAGYVFATKKEFEKFAKEICPYLTEKGYIEQIEKNQKMKFPTLIEFLGTYNPVDEKTGNLYPIPATSPKFLETFDIKTDMKFEGIPQDSDRKRGREILEKNKKLIEENIKFRILVRNLFIKDMKFIINRFGYYSDEFMSYRTPSGGKKIDPNILATEYLFTTENDFTRKLAISFLIKLFNVFAVNRESHFENYRLLEIEIPDAFRNGNDIFRELPPDLPDHEINLLIHDEVIGAGYSDYIFIFIVVAIIVLVILLKNEIYNNIKYVFGYKIGV